MRIEHHLSQLLEGHHQLLTSRRDAIAERWYRALAHAAFSPLPPAAIVAHLRTLVERLCTALTAEQFDDAEATAIGAALGEARFLHPDVLRATLIVLGEELGAEVPDALREGQRERQRELLGALAAGYTGQVQATILAEQEGIRAALMAERERIAAALQESEARFRAVFANAAIGITLADLEGRAVECNPATERILGYRQEELQRLVFTEITHPDDVSADRELYADLIAGRRCSYHKEKRYIHKHGHIVWCNLIASLLRDAEGAPRFIVGLIEDVTVQKWLGVAPVNGSTRMDEQGSVNPELQFLHPLLKVAALSEECEKGSRDNLTKRQRDVLHFVEEGLTNDEIAERLSLSPKTIKKHLEDVYHRLHVHNRMTAARIAREDKTLR